MKRNLLSIGRSFGVGFAAVLLAAPALAVTFTTNTTIGVFDTAYDGADIVITNCALTVDGPHGFASVRVLNGGQLTHTYEPSGAFYFTQAATDACELIGTNEFYFEAPGMDWASLVVTDTNGLITYSNEVDYVLAANDLIYTILRRTGNSAIPDGATVLVSYNWSLTVPTGVQLEVTNDVVIETGGAINADGRGCDSYHGTGHGNPSGGGYSSGSGGGYGGYGGMSSSNAPGGVVYGSTLQPLACGSGGGAGYGGAGGNGGGAVRLNVGGELRVNGRISANGGNGMNTRSGGGSGGGVWLTARTVTGAGSISANGGAGEPPHGGGGGGGRVAVEYATNYFSGTLSAFGGGGAKWGGAGTVYTAPFGEPGSLVLDNNGQAGTNTLLQIVAPATVAIRGAASAVFSGSHTMGSLLIASNSSLKQIALTATLVVSGDAVIESTGGLLANGAGYPANQGFSGGQGRSYVNFVPPYTVYGGGGGHSGPGGSSANTNAYGGLAYGSITAPNQAGSGGGGTYSGTNYGGAGGGAVRLTVAGTLLLNGSLSANGNSASLAGGGGGAGGSLWVTAGTLSGAGAISASGGPGLLHGGGGGGGRIALEFATNLFTGTLAAFGGGGTNWGGAGTVYTKPSSQSGLLLADNGGQVGPATPIGPLNASYVIRGGARLATGSSQTLSNLFIAPNSWLMLTSTTPALTVSGDATLQAGGGISADGAGFPANQGYGNGYGRTYTSGTNTYGGGGAHGGNGASGAITNASGGLAYGSIITPAQGGSGGGGYFNGTFIGGAGGGIVNLTVRGALLLDGTVSANGTAARSAGGGGGAGGAVRLSVGRFSGTGLISANGGSGRAPNGGGGGGGRIAVQLTSPTTNSFTGTMAAFGGGGAGWGGAGTVYSSSYAQSGRLSVDNGGNAGAATPVSEYLPATSMFVQGGSVLLWNYSTMQLQQLFIGTNSWLLLTSSVPTATISMTVSSNAIIQRGGGISANGAGYPANQGYAGGNGRYTQVGTNTYGGGGGHGGLGATGAHSNAMGGFTYGTISSPTYAGSGGGNFKSSASPGCAGGGVVRLMVNGSLALDGTISASGAAAVADGAGGGSGGSVWLTVRSLYGSGLISANGGNGHWPNGGGGGGGRIAIQYLSDRPTNSFAGTMTAYGGGGTGWGGAGTIYVYTNSLPGQLLVDNGGHAGDSTPLTISSFDRFVLNGGSVATMSPALGSLNLNSLFIGSNSWLVVTSSTSMLPMTINGSATIESGGGISSDGKGYPSGQGYGNGYGRFATDRTNTYGGGGAHGGNGAAGAITNAFGGGAYDSFSAPTIAGSGGGSPTSTGGAGGGILRLTVINTLLLDGKLSANGAAAAGAGAGGGAGGSVWLTAGSLQGSGLISANGGNGSSTNGGGGGGGRIVVQYTRVATNVFGGSLTAYGGGGSGYGGAGTIQLQPYSITAALTPLLLADNGGHSGTNTPLSPSPRGDVVVQGGAVLMPSGSQTYSNLFVGSNSALAFPPYPTSSVFILIASNATVEPGGAIQADAAGYLSGSGVGRGGSFTSSTNCGGGGGYGGFGAAGIFSSAYGGLTYGTASLVQDALGAFGSGGGGFNGVGGTGGGNIGLRVNGDLRLDGRISANGGNALAGRGGGGGSGGYVALTVAKLTGTGSISANGGNGDAPYGGGGGGGRIAINFNNPFQTNTFSGPVTAFGGGGFGWGGAGTVFLQTNTSGVKPVGYVIADNGGRAGTNTSFADSGVDVSVSGNAVWLVPDGATVRYLTLNSNGFATIASSSKPQYLTVTGDALIKEGGALFADGMSSLTDTGGGGGSHGGLGAGGPLGTAQAYGSITVPLTGGRRGGGRSGSAFLGGYGGGALRLSVEGALTVNGRLSANGLNGAVSGGGGAGGSLLVLAGTLGGSGVIAADGGAGNGTGGGGGGRIALHYGTNVFAGLVSAYGGGGIGWGGAGTIYFKDKQEFVGQLLVDNGGAYGTNTPLSSAFSLPTQPFNLTINNGAVVHPLTPLPLFSNLNIGPGGLLTTLASQTNLVVAVLKNVNIAPGGVLGVDGCGFAQAAGPGAGGSLASQGSGGGYGGAGGDARTGAPGGATYGSATQPVDRGSGGGAGIGPLVGGSEGGGAVRLTVGGTLTVGGWLCANGNAGWQDNSGGGSGGSLWITTRQLTGNGMICADGGWGEFFNGGGGGGGRIALYRLTNPATNRFSGSMTAYGGEGAWWGDDGTVFTASSAGALQVVGQTPSGMLSNLVSSVDLLFNSVLNPFTVTNTDVVLTTPAGVLPGTQLTVSALGLDGLRISFPAQTAPGLYTLRVGPQIEDLLGQAMSQTYTGTFIVELPVIQGTVTYTNGLPAPGVVLQPDNGLPAATTDASGHYTLGCYPGSSFTVTPTLSGCAFAPAARAYTNLTGSLTDEDYQLALPLAPTLSGSASGTNLSLSWHGLPGVAYQVYASTNLVDWEPCGAPCVGSNAVIQVPLPMSGQPREFFRVRTEN